MPDTIGTSFYSLRSPDGSALILTRVWPAEPAYDSDVRDLDSAE